MADSRDESFSPAASWATEETEETADDDMDYEVGVVIYRSDREYG